MLLPLANFSKCMQGSTTGYVRFETPEQAKLALDSSDDGKVVICDCAAFVKFLEGEEELDFFKKVGRTCMVKAGSCCSIGPILCSCSLRLVLASACSLLAGSLC